MISIVVWTGTFVNRDSTSSEAMQPVGLVSFIIWRKSSVELMEYLEGMYGLIMLLSCLAMLYTGVGICEIMGLSGLLGLWVLIVPYM